MNAVKEIYISASGLEKLKAELVEIENVKMKEIAKKIAEARDLGDLSENAEYQEAKERQSFLNGRAQELKYKIKYAKLIEECKNKDTVSAGCKVVADSDGLKSEFWLVGSDESDPMNGKISIESPLGRAMIGHAVGESISVDAPKGEVIYKILEIK